MAIGAGTRILPLGRPPDADHRPKGLKLKIKATVVLPEDGGPLVHVHLEPDFAILEHPKDMDRRRLVTWKFFNVPPDYTPTIVPVCFDPAGGNNKQQHVFLRPFRSLELEGGKVIGEPFYSTGGICWYEVVLVPRLHATDPKSRLYCTTSEMGGIDIEPAPAGG